MSDAETFLRRFAADKVGVSTIFLALSLTSILGFAGLAIDGSLWYADKRTTLGAADSAAFTAGVTYKADLATQTAATATANAISAAQAVAANYGYANGVNGVTVTVNSPPKSGSYQNPGTNNWAFEVIVNKPEHLFLSAMFIKSVSIASRAVVLYSPGVSGSGGGCIVQYATGGNTLIQNGATVNDNGCSYYGNGTGTGNNSALTVTATLNTAGLNVVGEVNVNNGGQINDTNGGNVGSLSGSINQTGGTVKTNATVTPATDPFADVTISSAETAAPGSGCPNTTATSYTTYTPPGKPTVLQPGYYCGGLSASNADNIELTAGVYVIEGGQFSIQGGITVTATGGVTIVLTNNGSGGSYATANIANGANVSLNAPTTGPTAGIVFLGDPKAPLSNTSTFAGGSTTTLNGAIEMRSQTVIFNNGSSITSNGNTAANSCTELIAGSVQFQGGNNFSIAGCAAYATTVVGQVAPTLPTLRIVE